MMIMILAGLQAISKEVLEAADVDGATRWQRFWSVIFPLMLPVSITAIMIRIIFKLKLADIIITVTAGGPGGATESVTSFIFRNTGPLQRRLRNIAGAGLSGDHHRVHDAVHETIRPHCPACNGSNVMSVSISQTLTPDTRFNRVGMRVVIYGLLILWAFICLFPLYWTLTTSFKSAADVMKGNMVPWVDFQPAMAGVESLGPVARYALCNVNRAGRISPALLEQHGRLRLCIRPCGGLGTLAAYGLGRFSYKFGSMRNSDISFFFLSS